MSNKEFIKSLNNDFGVSFLSGDYYSGSFKECALSRYRYRINIKGAKIRVYDAKNDHYLEPLSEVEIDAIKKAIIKFELKK